MFRHPDIFEQVVREQRSALRFEAERERLARLAGGSRPAAGFSLAKVLGRVRVRLTAPRGAAAALPRTAHPSGA